MKYLLDTSTCIDLIRPHPISQRLTEKFLRQQPGDVGISAITLSELEYGVAKSEFSARNRLVVTKFATDLTVVPYDEPVAAIYGQLRATLEKSGNPIGPFDLLIAAHAATLQVTLVTSNEREFRRIPGLKVENWLA